MRSFEYFISRGEPFYRFIGNISDLFRLDPLRLSSHPPRGARPFCRFATFSPFHRGNLPRRGKQEYSDSGKYNFAEQNITAASNITSQRKISLAISQISLPQRGTPRRRPLRLNSNLPQGNF